MSQKSLADWYDEKFGKRPSASVVEIKPAPVAAPESPVVPIAEPVAEVLAEVVSEIAPSEDAVAEVSESGCCSHAEAAEESASVACCGGSSEYGEEVTEAVTEEAASSCCGSAAEAVAANDPAPVKEESGCCGKSHKDKPHGPARPKKHKHVGGKAH